MPILWRDKMSVGNQIIDDEHKHLICLVNSVEIALQAQNHEDMVQFLLSQLHGYTRDHFAQEEKIMLHHQYTGYTEHKREHQKILSAIENIESHVDQLFSMKTCASDTLPLENSEEVTEGFQPKFTIEDIDQELVSLLKSWLIEHVLTTDKKLKRLFE